MNKPEQWHLDATTVKKAREGYFLALLAPGKPGDDRNIRVDHLDLTGAVGIRLTEERVETTVLFQREEGALATSGLTIDGSVGARQRDSLEKSVSGLLLAHGKLWEDESGVRLAASTDIDAELTISRAEDTGVVHVTGTVVSPSGPGFEPFNVELRLPGVNSIQSVISHHEVLDYSFEHGNIVLRLAPGEHQVQINVR